MKSRLFNALCVGVSFLFAVSNLAKADEFRFESDIAMGVAVSQSPVVARKINMAAGETIIIDEVDIWTMDARDWENGGDLILFNDFSLGIETKVQCIVTNEDLSMSFMEKGKRLTNVEMTGVIQSYSRTAGLVIDNCTWKK